MKAYRYISFSFFYIVKRRRGTIGVSAFYFQSIMLGIALVTISIYCNYYFGFDLREYSLHVCTLWVLWMVIHLFVMWYPRGIKSHLIEFVALPEEERSTWISITWLIIIFIILNLPICLSTTHHLW